MHHSFVKKQGMPIKTLRKNIPEAQQMLFCYCMFCTDGAGVLKNTHPWFALCLPQVQQQFCQEGSARR